MKFNDKKFQAIWFYAILDIGSYLNSDRADIKNVKDLGVIMSADLSFNEHINVIAAKGKQMAGWSLRVFKSREAYLMKTLLKQLFR